MEKEKRKYLISLVIRGTFVFFLFFSYKMDLDLWGYLGRKDKSCINAKFHRIELVICSHSKE